MGHYLYLNVYVLLPAVVIGNLLHFGVDFIFHACDIYCEIVNGRVLTIELYACRHQTLFCIHLFTDLFP